MKEKDLVSIIVPVYNVQDYLYECLNSILEQSYTNLEIICVDDGSKDNSGIICDEIAVRDSRVKVIHTTNQGLAMARNNGLDHAKGNYIAFIDSDDFIDKEYVSILLNLLKENDADISGCRFFRNDKNGKFIYPKENSSYDVVLESEEFIVRFYNDFGVFAPAWGKLFKASIWKNIRFYNRRFIEDAPMIRPIVLKCKRIAWCQKALYFYRDRASSLINSVVDPKACFDWLLEDIDFYEKNEMKNLQAVAQKTLCYKLCEVWDNCSVSQKKEYKKIYQKSLMSIWIHSGNTFAQKLKYTYLYYFKIIRSL